LLAAKEKSRSGELIVLKTCQSNRWRDWRKGAIAIRETDKEHRQARERRERNGGFRDRQSPRRLVLTGQPCTSAAQDRARDLLVSGDNDYLLRFVSLNINHYQESMENLLERQRTRSQKIVDPRKKPRAKSCRRAPRTPCVWQSRLL